MEMKDIIEKVNYYSKLIKERELTAEERVLNHSKPPVWCLDE